MNILFIQTNYPAFLDSFYKKHELHKKKYSYEKLKSLWAKEFFGSSNFYLKNLKRLGWNGDEIIANSHIIQNAWSREHKSKFKIYDLGLKKLLPSRVKNLLNLNSSEKKIVFEQIKFYKPEVVYIHDVTYFTGDELKKIKRGVKLVVGQIAYPLPLNKNILKNYDLLVSSFPHYVALFRKMGIKSEYLKWCVEDSIVKKIGLQKRVYDVTYVGGLSPHHKKGNKTLQQVSKKVPVNIWGYGKSGVPNAWGKDMYTIFAKSKIVINRHIDISKNYANNMRMFEATAMGSLLVTDHKSNMSEFFNVGKEVITYKNTSDLLKKIKYYLKHSKELERIAKAGQKRTLKDHTYNVRMKELDKILRNYL